MAGEIANDQLTQPALIRDIETARAALLDALELSGWPRPLLPIARDGTVSVRQGWRRVNGRFTIPLVGNGETGAW